MTVEPVVNPCPAAFDRQRFYRETGQVINHPIVCAQKTGHVGRHESGRGDSWEDGWAVYPPAWLESRAWRAPYDQDAE